MRSRDGNQDATNVLELLGLFRAIELGRHSSDIYEQAGIEYIEIRRWKGSDNDQDERATDIVLNLLRREIESFPSEEIAAAALDEIGRVHE